MALMIPLVLKKWEQPNLLLHKRWPWHLLFWTGYALFRFWLYYITVIYYPAIFLHYMLLSEIPFVAMTYFTLWLYRRLFAQGKYLPYVIAGTLGWILFLYLRTVFQFYFLKDEPAFRNNSFTDIFINSLTIVLASFLFVTACKYFKDGYIIQQFEAEKKAQHLLAEVNNLKSQIAPHFLFNTLNNLYGLAVEKSDKLPALMLQLSDLLRHSLYESQKPLVPISDEIELMKSYSQLERVRLEDDLQLEFSNRIPSHSPYQIAPLLLIVFVENAFKHAKFVQTPPVKIEIETALEEEWFSLTIRNNYNPERIQSVNGIGLSNVKRRLDVLYPNGKHQLAIIKDEIYFTVYLHVMLEKTGSTI
jgi:two-component system sensor histidine kinase LytS